MTCIDAYAHIGPPRYGTAEEALAFFNRHGIEKGNLVLGPGTPDLEGFFRLRSGPDAHRLRFFGIPAGETPEQRMELAHIQVAFGISGMRFMHFELGPNREVLDLLGTHGLCLLAINLYDSAAACRIALEWLERYPQGSIVSPHFLKPGTIQTGAEDPALFRDLLVHERFAAILSRHGGTGSQKAYPHPDLRPWVEDVVATMGWRKLMWGSEFPVLFQRDEHPEEAKAWIEKLGLPMTDQERRAFYNENAERWFFAKPCPGQGGHPELPTWLKEQYSAYTTGGQPVPLFPFAGQKLDLSMELYGKLLTHYLRRTAHEPDLRFGTFLAELLEDAARKF